MPCVLVLDPADVSLHLMGSLARSLLTVVSVLIGVAALAGGVQDWLPVQARRAEPLLLIASGSAAGLPGSGRRRRGAGPGRGCGADAETA
ncbi:MAG: hypothetical protein ACT4PQ_13160 [Betaproteobacteria bacterium]